MKSKLLWVILSLLSLKRNREFIIISTVLTGMVVQWVLWSNDGMLVKSISTLFNNQSAHYYTNYTISFLRSALFIVLVISAIKITESYRLIGLLIIINISMSCDLGTILSKEIYYSIKTIRYTQYWNFRDLYTTYEIFCITYFSISYIVRRIVDKIYGGFSSSNHGCDTSKVNRKNHGHKG